MAKRTKKDIFNCGSSVYTQQLLDKMERRNLK